MTTVSAGERTQDPVRPQTAAKHSRDGEMSGPPFKAGRGIAALVVAALVGALPLEGCSNPGEGAAQVTPGSGNSGEDPGTEQGPGVGKIKSKGPPQPVEISKLPRHGRGLN